MNTHESISPEDKGYRWIRDLKVWNETKPVIRVKMSRCLPCSNPCDSCFSPAPETPGALPQPETQTCTRVQMWKSIHSVPQYALALHCSVCWHGALIFFFFSIHLFKTASLFWLSFCASAFQCSWSAHFTQLRRCFSSGMLKSLHMPLPSQ